MTENLTRRTTLRRLVRRLWFGLAISVFALFALSAAGVVSAVAASPSRVGEVENDVDRAIADVVGHRPVDALADLPAGFVETMGYRPRIEAGRPVNPDGSCSSPIPLPGRFETLCRTHDFGYDLLRFGALTGREPAPWARRALDGMLVDAMHDSCTNPLCAVAAAVSDGGLTVNSWRQEWRSPTRETTADLAESTLRRAVDVIGGR